jgi:hypothetical protein
MIVWGSLVPGRQAGNTQQQQRREPTPPTCGDSRPKLLLLMSPPRDSVAVRGVSQGESKPPPGEKSCRQAGGGQAGRQAARWLQRWAAVGWAPCRRRATGLPEAGKHA